MDIYFSNLYALWEFVTNENTSGLIRSSLYKKTDFILISGKKLKITNINSIIDPERS